VGVVFLATPHGFSRTIVPQLLEQGMRVIDLSGAWRLREAKHLSTTVDLNNPLAILLHPRIAQLVSARIEAKPAACFGGVWPVARLSAVW